MIDVVFAAATYLPPDTLGTIFEADSLPVLGGSLSVSIPGSFLASAEVLLPAALVSARSGFGRHAPARYASPRAYLCPAIVF